MAEYSCAAVGKRADVAYDGVPNKTDIKPSIQWLYVGDQCFVILPVPYTALMVQ